MKKNMGTSDRRIRVLVALIAALLIYFEVVQGTFSHILMVVAAVFVLTSIVSFCPLYALVGLQTCEVDAKK